MNLPDSPCNFDRDGEPMTWEQVFEPSGKHAHNGKRVAVTETKAGARVSTVWLGMNHSYGDGPPVIFESMVFGLDDDDERCERYSTEWEAIHGHIALVAEYGGPA